MRLISHFPFLLDRQASENGSATRLYAEDSGGRSCTRKAMHNLAGSDVRVELAYGEEMRVHRSLFNPKDDGKWRFAPYGEGGGAIVDARPVSVRPLPACTFFPRPTSSCSSLTGRAGSAAAIDDAASGGHIGAGRATRGRRRGRGGRGGAAAAGADAARGGARAVSPHRTACSVTCFVDVPEMELTRD